MKTTILKFQLNVDHSATYDSFTNSFSIGLSNFASVFLDQHL